MPASPAPRRILLVGMMGSGKSTIGRELAARLGWPYVDNDDLVHRAAGQTARELLAAGGTAAVRAAEAAALDAGLAEPPPVIVGVAAGTILDASARARLARAGTVVWLRARPATLVRRTAAVHDDPSGAHRPWYGGRAGAAAWFETEDERREPLYAAVADVVVNAERADGTEHSPAELAEAVVDALG
jgi:shikimate kinase